ncbi:MAG: hypothetical protein JRD05_10485 [Deltaproteobacteria bacterium]|nr:hypothetical protein [Deltaproteobacteria bacterium]
MAEFFINNFWAIAAGILGSAFVGYIAYWNNRKNRTAEAAIKFRNKILTELEGLYPVTHYWDKNIFPRFYVSIPKIESAAIEFRHYVFHKTAFDSAVKVYCEYCKNITWNKVSAYAMYKDSMYKPDDKGPREKFKHIVESLLSFAKEK